MFKILSQILRSLNDKLRKSETERKEEVNRLEV